jgi:integrase
MVARLLDNEAEARFSVRVARFESGERFPLIVDRRGLPVPVPNQWALLMRRPRVQANTLIADLRTIAHLYDWASRRNIDLDERLGFGRGLDPVELTALYQNLRYSRPFGRASAAGDVVDATEAEPVCGDTHIARVACVRDCLVWVMERAVHRLAPDNPQVREIRARIEVVKRTAVEFQRPASDGRPCKKGLTPEQVRRLLQIIDPTFADNPFQRPVRFRNMVLLLVLLSFGFRRGESLKIYVSDVQLKGRTPTLAIVRRPDDPNDPRRDEPAVKTLGRSIHLAKSMAQILDAYVCHHRPQFPNSDESPFLFFSRAGKPLSLRMVNKICEQIRERFPEFDGALTPHVLRYTFNKLFLESCYASGLSADDIKQAQNYLNGWRLHSEQGSEYGWEAIEQHAREISLAHQRRLFA